jgi:hypothetical protein
VVRSISSTEYEPLSVNLEWGGELSGPISAQVQPIFDKGFVLATQEFLKNTHIHTPKNIAVGNYLSDFTTRLKMHA